MPKIIQLSPHIANLIAAGEVVERPASVVKELLENAVDAGASKVTVEIRDGGMTFLRITDNGCGMTPEDAKIAFKRHATSKLRTAEDLAAIGTMGFRGEALAAIASVSRIDLMTKTPGALSGTSLHLEAGEVQQESEIGCPEGTTIIIRDLFYNTPARMKFMKSDTVEGGRVTSAVELQALAHPELAISFLRDGKQILSTPGTGDLKAAVYCIYGRDCAKMLSVDSRWEQYSLTGYVSLPTDARPSRALQTFFVNGRPVKSRLLTAALEEAYRNQLMVGKFPACVLHLTLPAGAVDVNVHPAKTEVKFLGEKAVFDCVHYGVLGALNKGSDRPQLRFQSSAAPQTSSAPQTSAAPQTSPAPKGPVSPKMAASTQKKDFFRTMTAQEYKEFSAAIAQAPQPSKEAAAAAAAKIERPAHLPIRDSVLLPQTFSPPSALKQSPLSAQAFQEKSQKENLGSKPEKAQEAPPAEVRKEPPEEIRKDAPQEPEQLTLPMPEQPQWRMVGELYHTYILVEQGAEAFLIDKHAAHERILFEKLKANPEAISSQTLLSPVSVRLTPNAVSQLLSSADLLESLGFEAEEFGERTLLVRRIPMDLRTEDVSDALETLADDLQNGRRESPATVRDQLLHTVACKAAIKAGWHSDQQELLAIVKAVMADEQLKYCPHGRPICVSLSKRQLERQFKRN